MRTSKFYLNLSLFLALAVPALAANSTVGPSSTASSSARQINTRLKNQWMLIQKGLKTGNLTNNQVTSLKAALVSVHQQEITFFKQNGNHVLTPTQQTTLNSMLNNNSSLLGEPQSSVSN